MNLVSKHPKNVSAKADIAKQEEFNEKCLALVTDSLLDELTQKLVSSRCGVK